MRRAGLLLLCAWLVLPGARAEDAEATRAQLKQLDREIRQLKDTIGDNQAERTREARKLRAIEKDVGRVAAELHRIKTQRDAHQNKLNDLQRRQGLLRQQQSKQKAIIAEQIRDAYTLGQERRIKMLLNQEDPEKLSRMLTYYDYFNEARSEQLERYRQTLSSLQALIPEIASETEKLADAEEELQEQQAELQEQKQKRADILAGIDRELSSQSSQLSNLDSERKGLESVLKAIEQDIANIAIPASYKPFKEMRGKLPWPVAGRRLNSYGSSRQGSAIRWQGIQIAGNEGDSIHSIHNGRVVFADWLRGAGLLIIVDHGDDYLSLYAHNESLLRQEGDWVRGGEAIATVGNSGGRRQAGVYFEIRHKGRPRDPAAWCN